MKRLLPWVMLAGLGCTTLNSPLPVSPAGGEEVTTPNPVFTWHPVPNARSYLIQISADAGFSDAFDTLVFDDSFFVLVDTLELGQAYYWRLYARNSQGVESDPSNVADFVVRTGVELVAPGPTDSTAWPVFSWEAYPGATDYHFIISQNSDFSYPAIDTLVSTESYTPEDSLAPLTYYWRVQAMSGVTEHSSPSPARMLVTYRLADTYFPLYLGRTQTFNWIHQEGTYNSLSEEWVVAKTEEKTVTVVLDSFLDGDRIYWSLSDTLLRDVGPEVSVAHDSLFSPEFFMATVYPNPSQVFRSWRADSFIVNYQGEDLILTCRAGTFAASEYDSISITRTPGRGTISQVHLTSAVPVDSITYWKLDSFELDLQAMGDIFHQ